MKGQTWYVALLIGLMCVIRFSLSIIGYADPHWLMEQLSIPIASNVQMPYVIRVWAIRDIVLAVLVAFAHASTVKALLLACVAIDAADIVSAYLSNLEGLFSVAEAWSLVLVAVAALLPELVALALISLHDLRRQVGMEGKQSERSETIG